MTSICRSMTIRAGRRYETDLGLHIFCFPLDLCINVPGQGYSFLNISVHEHSEMQLIPVEHHMTDQHTHMGEASQ